MRRVVLDEAQRVQFEGVRDHATRPYLRERAAGILKVAAGQSAAAVARSGLLRAHNPDTVRDWLNRYRDGAIAGLRIRGGRGRRPAFSPPVPQRGRRHGRALARGAP